MLELSATLQQMRAGVTFRARTCEVLEVSGEDALSYLDGQLTQDLTSLSRGGTTEAFLLEPQGKVVSYLRVHVRSPESVALVVSDGFGEATEERLGRFKVRVKAAISRDQRRLLELRGPGFEGLLAEREEDGADVLAYTWPEYFGADLVGGDYEPDATLEGAGAAFEAARIAAGVPVMGAEITEKTIVQELGEAVVRRAVSFTKGCYTGQELVARIDARGNNVARRLCSVHSASFDLAPGPVRLEGAEVGTVTSASRSSEGSVGLGYVKRGVELPFGATVGGIEVDVVALADQDDDGHLASP